jgi:hypothetical protein
MHELQDGTFITAWRQFGQPSPVFSGRDDTLYVGAAFRHEVDTAQRVGTAAARRAAWHRGQQRYRRYLARLIPDPTGLNIIDRGTSASEIAADVMGNIYATGWRPHDPEI